MCVTFFEKADILASSELEPFRSVYPNQSKRLGVCNVCSAEIHNYIVVFSVRSRYEVHVSMVFIAGKRSRVSTLRALVVVRDDSFYRLTHFSHYCWASTHWYTTADRRGATGLEDPIDRLAGCTICYYSRRDMASG